MAKSTNQFAFKLGSYCLGDIFNQEDVVFVTALEQLVKSWHRNTICMSDNNGFSLWSYFSIKTLKSRVESVFSIIN